MQRSKAFTLIELLVVIAIIAILAAILFPVFAQAKLAAKKTADLSNFKQMGLGIAIYTNDSDDVYPLSYFNSGDFSQSYFWSSKNCVQPYVKNLDLYKSPVDSFAGSKDAAFYGIATDRKPVPISMMVNAITPAYDMFCVSNPQGWMPAPANMPPYAGTASATSATAAPEPSTIILLANGYKEFYGDYYGCAEWLNNEIDWCYAPTGVTEQYIIQDLVYATPDKKWYPAWRKFTGGTNFAFGDGSAKLLKPNQLLDPKRWIINPPAEGTNP
ncbi:hypothetical protein BH11ARM2_BH11ARM2_39690 [soil metagenome]